MSDLKHDEKSAWLPSAFNTPRPVPQAFDPEWPADAEMSPGEVYRWWLTRNVPGEGCKPLVICGLNPSTADATKNDATIRKEMGFAQRWGYAWLIKVNLYAWRATKPADMFKTARSGVDVVGHHNDVMIVTAARLARELGGRFMVAWGRLALLPRVDAVVALLGDTPLWCWGVNESNGSPEHPLYVPYERVARRWLPREVT